MEEYGVEIKLNEPDDFLKIRETLQRIGVASTNPEITGSKAKALVQSAHIYHVAGRYFIVHFKELFKMEERERGIPSRTEITNEDYARRNYIAFLLQEWNLSVILEPSKYETNRSPMSKVKVIPFREKEDWNLVSKHSLGKTR